VQIQTSISNKPRVQRGATMIELLVSILIFAFGMLGMVGLQTRALSFSQISLYRSQASALSDDIFDRMRADRVNAIAGNWATGLTDPSTYYTGTSVAQLDLKDWKEQIERLLPNGQAQIVVNAGGVQVRIEWYERESGAKTAFETVSNIGL
jgi:type IV pilus assembly protein PilV